MKETLCVTKYASEADKHTTDFKNVEVDCPWYSTPIFLRMVEEMKMYLFLERNWIMNNVYIVAEQPEAEIVQMLLGRAFSAMYYLLGCFLYVR